MIEIKDTEKCSGCSACYNCCPVGAIVMRADSKGFKYPQVNKDKCIKCNKCSNICPVININKNNNENKSLRKAYACYNKEEKIRLESSSGGVFTLLAIEILNQGGIVFGAALDDEFKVRHICIKDKVDLYKLRTSKYVQSEINECYKLAKEYLDKEQKVLFTGTPCQLGGLDAYLGKEYKNLYKQDIICHGVPSPLVWEKYKEFRKKIDNKKPIYINFRNKDSGWKIYNLMFKYSEEDEYKKNQHEDLFMQAFLRDACLRDSCYNCSFKSKDRNTDITLADFWGIDKIRPEINDDKGLSLVIVNTEKGMKLFETLKDDLVIYEMDFEESINYNKSMFKSVAKPKNRDKFFENLDKLSFDKLVKKYTINKNGNLLKRIIRKLKKKIKNN